MCSEQTIEGPGGRRITVRITREGWTVREEADHQVLRTVTYTDWHRVERAVQMFERRTDGPLRPV